MGGGGAGGAGKEKKGSFRAKGKVTKNIFLSQRLHFGGSYPGRVPSKLCLGVGGLVTEWPGAAGDRSGSVWHLPAVKPSLLANEACERRGGPVDEALEKSMFRLHPALGRAHTRRCVVGNWGSYTAWLTLVPSLPPMVPIGHGARVRQP